MNLHSPNLQTFTPFQLMVPGDFYSYALTWRQHSLIVRTSPLDKCISLPSAHHPDWLMDCLHRSPVKLVKLDPSLGPERLQIWAEASRLAGKPVYLRVPSTPDLPSKRSPRSWAVKKMIDRLGAATLLIMLLPLLCILAMLLYLDSGSPILACRWQIGERGRLFRSIQFRTQLSASAPMQAGNTGQYQLGLIRAKPGDASKRSPTAMDHSAFGNWLQESGLYKLPQLLNVIRGEMSLVGPRPYPLSSIGQIKPDHQQILNALPALIAPGSLKARSQSWEFQTRNLNVLCYFRQWSLWQDMKSLLSAIPQVWSALIP